MALERFVGIFGLLFLIAMAVRTWLVYRRTGHLPISVNSDDAAHTFVQKVLLGIVVLLAINILTFRLQALYDHAGAGQAPDLYSCLQRFEAMETRPLLVAGIVLAYSGLIWCMVAQHQMGQSWRFGIVYDDRPALITSGLFALSRHPIYFGLIVVTVGLFLATPNAVTLLCMGLAIVSLSIEARLEEAYMRSVHGEPYEAYLSRTRRWI